MTSPDATTFFEADTGSGELRSLTAGTNMEAAPSLSPDGTRVAFGSRHLDDDIIELPLDGSGTKALLATSRNEHCVSWSPARPQFLFRKEREGTEEVWLRSVDEGWEPDPAVDQRRNPRRCGYVERD